MTPRKNLLLLVPALLLPAASWAQNIQWSNPEKDKKYRTPIENMKVYYEPENVKESGGTVAFKTYRSADPANQDEAGHYVINCKTQEFVSLNSKGEPMEPPMQILPGEHLYPIGKKLCDWGPGFIRRMLN